MEKSEPLRAIQIQIQRSRQKLEEKVEQEINLSDCARIIMEDQPDAVERALERLLDISQTDQAVVIENIENPGGSPKGKILYSAGPCYCLKEEKAPPPLDYARIFTSREMASLEAGFSLESHFSELPESTQEYLENRRFRSGIIIPILQSNRWFGLLALCDSRKTMNWGKEHRGLLQAAAEFLGFYFERKEAERERSKLTMAVEQSSVAIEITDNEGIIEYVNPKYCDITGYSREELLGQSCALVASAETPEAQHRELWDTISAGFTWQGIFQNKKKHGESFWVRTTITPLMGEKREITHYIAVQDDITREIRDQENLKKSEQKFQTMFDSMGEGVLLHTAAIDSRGILEDYRFQEANPAFRRLFDLKDPFLKGKLGREVFTEEDPFLPCLRKFVENGQSSFELHYAPLNRHLLLSVTAPEPNTFITVVSDITKIKLLEKQLIQAQKMEAVGHLAGGVAHDFNNYLMAIMSLATLLTLKKKEDPQVLPYAEEIIKASKSAAKIAEGLLLFSRREGIHPKVQDLRIVLHRMNKMIHHLVGEGIEYDVIVPEKPVRALVDEIKMNQVLFNLSTNARDAMKGRGSLQIRLSTTWISEFLMKKHNITGGRDFACIAVRDTGTGIPPELMERIFEPFFTTKGIGEGTGLGLSVSYGIIEQHRGFFEVDCRSGEGTAFEIYLPLEHCEEEISSEDETPLPRGRGETILLVDDQEEVLRSLREALVLFGYRVITAGTAEEARLQFQRHKKNLGLLLLDVRLPRRGGLSLWEEFQKERPLPVIFMSGYARQQLEREGERFGQPLMQKPIKPDRLVRRIQEVLAQSDKER